MKRLICFFRGHVIRCDVSYWPRHTFVYWCARCQAKLPEPTL